MRSSIEEFEYILWSHDAWKPGTIQPMRFEEEITKNIRDSAFQANQAIEKMIKGDRDD